MLISLCANVTMYQCEDVTIYLRTYEKNKNMASLTNWSLSYEI